MRKKFDMRKTYRTEREINAGHRQRGALLLEAMLAVGVAAALIGVTALIIKEESVRQDNELIAAEQRIIVEGAQSYVAERYEDIIRTDLFSAAQTSPNGALIEMSLQDLVDDGYLPAIVAGGGAVGAVFGHEYRLLIRAVNGSDLTMTEADMDGNGDGIVDASLLDGNPDNGEIEIESILVSIGGSPIPSGRAGDVIARTGLFNAGFVNTEGVASGSFGSFEFPMDGFEGTGSVPSVGSFATIVSLSNFGVIGSEGGVIGSSSLRDAFLRCEGMDPALPEYDACLNSNDVYTDIYFRSYDSDGDGTPDVFPAIRNLSSVSCDDDRPSGLAGEFLVDCALTRLTGDFVVEGSNIDLGPLTVRDRQVLFGGEQILRREEVEGVEETVFTSDRIVASGINQASGGQDLAEGIFNSRVSVAGDILEKPTCPAYSIGGEEMRPRIYLTPAAYADQGGRPIVGVRAFAEDVDFLTGLPDPDGDAWRVRLVLYVNQDFCNEDVNFNSPLQMDQLQPAGDGFLPNDSGGGDPEVFNGRCSTFDTTTGEVISNMSDGRADVYEVPSTLGAALIHTRCF
jgi:hypothetical protein